MVTKSVIGILGVGMVGSQLKRYFESAGFIHGKNLLCFDTDLKKKCTDDISASNILFVCLPTPQQPDGSCDVSLVERVVAKYASPSRLIVIKSTVEPMTCEMLARKYNAKIFFNPEFLTESRGWEDMINPDRQIVGHTTASKNYSSFILNLLPKAFFSSPGSLGTYTFTQISATEAEIGKYAGNTFGALKVTFGNIFADICRGFEVILKKKNKDSVDYRIEYNNVRSILAHDRRIGDAWLDVNHGNYRGYGGYCFPKDTNALIAATQKIIKRLPRVSSEAVLLKKGLKLFEAMRDYNCALLESQGLDEKSVSRHDHELKKKLKTKRI